MLFIITGFSTISTMDLYLFYKTGLPVFVEDVGQHRLHRVVTVSEVSLTATGEVCNRRGSCFAAAASLLQSRLYPASDCPARLRATGLPVS